MNTATRMVNFLLTMILTFMLLQLFFPPAAPKPLPQAGGLTLKTLATEYAIPSVPHLEIANTTSGALSVDTCKQIKIFYDGKEVSQFPKDFCKTLAIAPKSKAQLELKALSPLFLHSGDFVFQLQVDKTSLTANVKQVEQGFFHSVFSWLFYAPIYNIFIALLAFLPSHSLGFAIIILTLLVRFVLYFWQSKMIVSQQKLAALQPKIQKIQEQYKDDQAKAGMEVFALYKKEGVNPMGSCLPLLIQMPLMFGVYLVVATIGDVTNSFYIYQPLSFFNTANIDTNFFGISLIASGGVVGGITAVLAAFFQFIQIKLSTPAPASTTPKILDMGAKVDDAKNQPSTQEEVQRLMQKMMIWMFPAMLGISAYFFPIGVGIYWIIGTIFLIFQQLIVTRTLKKEQK